MHMASNKETLLVVLYSSKTHSKSNIPQEIKIASNEREEWLLQEKALLPLQTN